jgi:predicted nucleic acid-binding protein
MILISNTGPLIALAKIDKIDIIDQLGWEEVCIPEIVHKELWAKMGPESNSIDRALHDFICVKSSEEPIDDFGINPMNLDPGERQVIQLGWSSNKPATLLLDDRAGRSAARELGLSLIGTIGLLIMAKTQKKIDRIEPLMLALRSQGYWLSDTLMAEALKTSGEQ